AEIAFIEYLDPNAFAGQEISGRQTDDAAADDQDIGLIDHTVVISFAGGSPKRAILRHSSGRPAAVDVLDRRLVAPGDLIARDPENFGDLVTFRRARRPAAQKDGQDALLI